MPADNATTAPCHGSAPKSGSQSSACFATIRARSPPAMRASATDAGASDIRSRSRHKRDTIDLLQGGFAESDRFECRFAQKARSVGPRRILDLPHRCALRDELPNLVVEDEELGYRLAPRVARAAAFTAAAPNPEAKVARRGRIEPRFAQDSGIGIFVGCAMWADEPHQPLGEDRVQRGYKAIEIDVHVHETADHVENVVRVHRGKHEVTGKRRLHGDVRGLGIAYL